MGHVGPDRPITPEGTSVEPSTERSSTCRTRTDRTQLITPHRHRHALPHHRPRKYAHTHTQLDGPSADRSPNRKGPPDHVATQEGKGGHTQTITNQEGTVPIDHAARWTTLRSITQSEGRSPINRPTGYTQPGQSLNRRRPPRSVAEWGVSIPSGDHPEWHCSDRERFERTTFDPVWIGRTCGCGWEREGGGGGRVWCGAWVGG